LGGRASPGSKYDEAAAGSGIALKVGDEEVGKEGSLAAIGQQITHAEETVSARPALAAEAERLKIRPGTTVLTIARVYHTEKRPVETASIVLPVERYSLVYEIPVR